MIDKYYKINNDDGDALADIELSMLAEKAGLTIQRVECFVKEIGTNHYREDWTGLIGEGYEFFCPRPTITAIQTWLRVNHMIHVFIGFRPNTKKFDSHAYDMNLSGKEYIKSRSFRKFYNHQLYDDYNKALSDGVKEGLELLIKK